jgi:hypothetical protein
MHVAGRTQNAAMAGTAVQQIEAALETMRTGGMHPMRPITKRNCRRRARFSSV